MFFLRPPSDERVRTILSERAAAGLTYPHEGLTRRSIETAPRGFRLDVYGAELGRGELVFARAWDALRSFAHYPPSFTHVVTLGDELEAGLVFGTVARHFGFASMHPCRVLFVIEEDSPLRRGFALGTLPGHVGCGEECFLLTLDPDTDIVGYDVQAISRPYGPLAFAAAPFFTLFQRRFQRETLATMRGHCRGVGEAIE